MLGHESPSSSSELTPLLGILKLRESRHPLLGCRRGDAARPIAEELLIDADGTRDGWEAGREVLEQLVAGLAPGPGVIGERHDPDVHLGELSRLRFETPRPVIDPIAVDSGTGADDHEACA